LCSAIYFGAIFFRDYYYFHNLDISLSDEEPDFIQVKILLNGRENPLRNLKMGYKVVEKVVKQNGSSKHVLTNDCYKFSYPQPLIEKQGTITARFPFQEYPNYPPSFAHESKEINWFVFFQIPGLLSSKTKDVPIKVSYKNGTTVKTVDTRIF